MTLRPDSQARTRNRFSPCCRHPDETLPGICASCIRERLSSLDAFGASAAKSDSSDFRRCRSVSVSHAEDVVARCGEQHRKSCDVASGRGSLSLLFNADDVKSSESNSEARVESSNLGLSRVTYTLVGNRNGDEIRGSGGAFVEQNVDIDEELDEGEFKTMKEYIDLEFGNKSKKSKDLRELSGNFWGAASVFRQKLRNWRQKNKVKKLKSVINANGNGKSIVGDGDTGLCDDRRNSVDHHLDLVGRKSCDTEPRFSIDAGQIPFDEPRASWDGYMIARSIPRLAPMFSVVENGLLGNINRFENNRLSIDGPMHSIMEDESSSGVSGLGSGHSNSDSSSSMRRSSFDRSSSVRSFGKKLVNPGDQGSANVKLVITEKELNDWHLSSNKDDGLEKFGSVSRIREPKMSVRWHKVCNALGFKHNCNQNKIENFAQNVADSPTLYTSDNKGMEAGRDLSQVVDWKLPRSRSVVGSRNSSEVIESNYSRRSVDSADRCEVKGREEFMLEGTRSPQHTSDDLDGGIMPFYMAPLRSVKSNKLGKFKTQSSHYGAENVFY